MAEGSGTAPSHSLKPCFRVANWISPEERRSRQERISPDKSRPGASPVLFASVESSSASAGRRAISQGLQGDDDFAYLLVAFEVPVGVDGLIEGEGPGDLRLEGSIRQAIVYVFLHGFPLRGATQFAEGVAEHADGSTKGSQGEGRGLAREHAIQEYGATVRCGLRECVDVVAADRIDYDAGTFASGDGLHAGDQVLFFRDDDVVGAEGQELILFGGGTGGGDGDASLRLHDLDGREPNGRAGGGDDDEVAGSHFAEGHERAVSGAVLHPNSGTLHRGEGLWNGCENAGGNDGLFRKHRVLVHRKTWNGSEALADEGRIDLGANGDDLSQRLVPNAGGRGHLFQVDAVIVHAFGPVEAHCFHLEQNFTRTSREAWPCISST